MATQQNTLITNDIIAKLVLMEFKNQLQLAKTANRQWQNVFDNTTGKTIRIRKPVRLVTSTGADLVTQPIDQRFDNLVIDQRKHVGIVLTSEQLTLQLNDFNDSVIKPAMQSLANTVDSILFQSAVASYNYVGTAGTAPGSFAVINSAKAKMNALGIPMQDRYCIMSENDGAILQNSQQNLFNQPFTSKITLDGMMGRLAGFDMYTGQNVTQPTSVTGTIGTPAVMGAGQTGATLLIDGITSATLAVGTVFQIAGVFAVNPISYNSTTQLANFVVTTAVTSTGSATLAIDPPIITSGAYQNVTNAPADNALITFQPTHTINLAYHKEAFTLAMINLYSPPANQNPGAYFKNLVDKDAGISLRMARQYNIKTDEDTVRVDALFGVKCFGEYMTRVMGS